MDKLFRIGDFCFHLLFPENLVFPSKFRLFEIKQGVPEYTYQFCITDEIPLPEENSIAKRSDLMVYQTSFGENRMLGIKGRKQFYACYREVSEKQAYIDLLSQEVIHLHIDPIFTSLLALERRMIGHSSLILHCAYVVYQGKAILFSAPSGIGKSTQAELWERYRGGTTVNGDRALLRKINGAWTACAWPVCGSSEICKLGDFPIRSVVMLKQGKINDIKRLSPIQAFTQLYAQVTINQWNRTFVQHAMELIEDLIGQVPVYQLTCNMTENAVSCLEHALFSEPNPVKEG